MEQEKLKELLEGPAVGFLQGLEDRIANAMNSFVFDVYAALVTEYRTVILSCGILYIVLYAMAVVQGYKKATVESGIATALKFIVIMAALTNYDEILKLMNEAFTYWPEEIILTIINSTSNVEITKGIGAMDSYFDQAMILSVQVMEKASPLHWLPFFIGFCLGLSAIVLCVIPLGMATMATVGIGLLLGISPIFIVFKFYDSTKAYFDNWVKSVMTLVFLKILVYCAMVIALFVIREPFKGMITAGTEGVIAWSDGIAIFVTAVVMYMLYKQLGGMASTLGGGFYSAASSIFENTFGTALGAAAPGVTKFGLAKYTAARDVANNALKRALSRGE